MFVNFVSIDIIPPIAPLRALSSPTVYEMYYVIGFGKNDVALNRVTICHNKAVTPTQNGAEVTAKLITS